ncbi:MAG: hypothetical protein OXI22_05030 [Defluviicoccus sp.]|nr:hypothetical protein [Defluviicoccus sp.]
MACCDIARKRRRNLERFHQRSAERRAAGLCLKCGKAEPAPERTLCEPCLEKRRAADRARTARLRAEGKPRRDPERTREYERERSRQQHAERRAAGICTKCGKAQASPDRTLCEPCAEVRRAHDRARHAKAKAEDCGDAAMPSARVTAGSVAGTLAAGRDVVPRITARPALPPGSSGSASRARPSSSSAFAPILRSGRFVPA